MNLKKIRAGVFKVKSDKVEVWRAWCAELSTDRRAEAEVSLREEGLVQEVVFEFVINGETYILGEMVGEGFPANMDRDINQKHKKIKEECLESVSRADVLYSIIIDGDQSSTK